MKTPIQRAPQPTREGFTLVELLVVITIIITLAALSFMGVSRLRASASAAVDVSDMKQVGTAIQLYTSEHNGFLPVSASGVSPTYKKEEGTLLYSIAAYLGRDNPKEGDFFPELAAASWQKATKASTAPSLLLHQTVYTGAGKFAGNPMRPDPSTTTFGYPYNPKRDPKSFSAVISLLSNPATCLMMSEIDKLHPEFKVSQPSWLAGVPEGMAHGSYRLGLYWDGHVGTLDVNLNAK